MIILGLNAIRGIKIDMIGMNAMFIHLQPSLPNNTYFICFLSHSHGLRKKIFTLYDPKIDWFITIFFSTSMIDVHFQLRRLYLNLLRGLFERASSAQTCMERRLCEMALTLDLNSFFYHQEIPFFRAL